ncbi:bb3a4030-b0be-42be-b4ec-b58eacf211c8 [Sclerotinia trifoliorum]|uniref:Bb3a4030-b0be-42be-b4ec-b58eacf211c8 n=1 Tax=Sclerotinia trifoliorum TaxID=28548 RepID=A0A8H2W2L0_9HELO|nr:bb3a4030-b0be-42be-b4ec-b58eacf211c8 [Sclerotinia trifoliorum]
MSFIVTQFSSPYIPLAARQEALDRAFADPGIPGEVHTTKSFWMKEPHPEVASVQSEHLPEIADYVIIGSGITGASVAQALLEGLEKASPSETQSSSQPKVIMLEARDSCSGATGRNGGHILETGEEYAMLKERLGKYEAIKIHKLRISHLEALIKSAENLGLTEESQVRKVRFLSVYFHKEAWEDIRKDIEVFMTDMPSDSKGWGFIEADELAKVFGIPNAAGAVTGIAGAMWPYKFVTGLLAHLRKQFPSNFLLETNTSVSQIHGDEHYFEVITPRGTIKSKHVIHCTNAHIGHLVPGIKGCIFPIVGQMSAQPPGDKFKHQSDHSWIFNYAHGFDYLTQLPISSISNGEMMMGGGYAQTQNGGIHEAGISKDSKLNMYANIHLRGVLGAVFAPDNWGALHEPAVKSMWTGNMGFSTDGLPWVGALPESLTDRITTTQTSHEGAEWAAAAFSGEGMVHAWLCGKALAEMILAFDAVKGGVVIPEWFPEAMVISEERLVKARLARYAKERVI